MGQRVSVPKPCTANWETMPGSEQLRHCPACGRTVYNFSEMTSAEVERALTQSAERVCARIVQRTDGTVVTRGQERTGRWSFAASAPRIAGAALTALLASGMAKPAVATPARPSELLQIAGAQETKPALTIGVDDESGAVVLNALVTIINKETGAQVTSATDGDGLLRLNDLAKGIYKVTVASPGFRNTALDDVAVPASALLNVRLRAGKSGPTVFVGEIATVPPEPAIAQTPEKLVEPVSKTSLPHQDSPIRRFFRKLGHLFS